MAPMRCRASVWEALSSKSVNLPEVWRVRPSRMLRVVVLPEPLGPRRPKMRPRGTSMDRLSTAMIGPYRLVRPWVRITELFIGGALSASAQQEVQNFLQGVAATFDLWSRRRVQLAQVQAAGCRPPSSWFLNSRSFTKSYPTTAPLVRTASRTNPS